MDRELTNRMMDPKAVVVIYGNSRGYEHYIEYRPLRKINNKVVPMQATPMPDTLFRDIAKSYNTTKVRSVNMNGWVDEHIIYASNNPGSTIVMWWRPAHKRMLNMKTALQLSKPVEVCVPAILHLIVNKDMYVYALANDARPDEDTALYNAPFFNVYKDGAICLGTARVGKDQTDNYGDEVYRFENGFYSADQTHGHYDEITKTNLTDLWHKLIKSGEPFPAGELIRHQYKTIEQMMYSVIQKKGHE